MIEWVFVPIEMEDGDARTPSIGEAYRITERTHLGGLEMGALDYVREGGDLRELGQWFAEESVWLSDEDGSWFISDMPLTWSEFNWFLDWFREPNFSDARSGAKPEDLFEAEYKAYIKEVKKELAAAAR